MGSERLHILSATSSRAWRAVAGTGSRTGYRSQVDRHLPRTWLCRASRASVVTPSGGLKEALLHALHPTTLAAGVGAR